VHGGKVAFANAMDMVTLLSQNTKMKALDVELSKTYVQCGIGHARGDCG